MSAKRPTRPKQKDRRPLLALAVLTAALTLVSYTDTLFGSQPAAKGPIVANGIDGSLVLCGDGEAPAAALQEFCKLAGGKKGRVVVIRSSDSSKTAQAVTQGLLETWEAQGLAGFTVLRLSSAEAQKADGLTAVKQATAVWLATGPGLRELLTGSPLGAECQALLKRGGVVAASGPAAEALSHVTLPSGDDGAASPGMAWLPDSIVVARAVKEEARSSLVGALKQNAGLVGYEVVPGSALVVTGRNLRSVGNATVAVHVAASAAHPALMTPLTKKGNDLTIVRRIALERTDANFPPAKPGVPFVEKGNLVIVGGGDIPEDIAAKFLELAGGKEALIVVLPAAGNDPLTAKNKMGDRMRKAGAKSVVVLLGRQREEVEKPEYINALRKATGIWFDGGRQGKIIDAYEGTMVQALVYDVLRRGGVVGGSSAGASIQTEYLVRGSPGAGGNMFEGYERGFNFLPGLAIDQHFSKRDRFGVMSKLMKTYPQFLGIGIDESTALIVQGHVAEIMGKGKIYVFDTTKPVEEGKKDYEIVPVGARFDLKARKVLSLPEPEKKEAPKLFVPAAVWEAAPLRVLEIGRRIPLAA